jgi:hypothetical protein
MQDETIFSEAEIGKYIPNWRELPLTKEEAVFAILFVLNGRDEEKAYNESGLKGNVFARISLMNEERWVSGLQSVASYCLGKKKADLEARIFETLHEQAFYDPADIITSDGELRVADLKEIPKSLRRCIEGIEHKNLGREGSVKVVKLADRQRAIRELSDYIGMTKKGAADVTLSMSSETEKALGDVFSKAARAHGQ